MRLKDEDIELFYKLNRDLLFFVNQKLRFFSSIKSMDDLFAADIQTIVAIRNKLYENARLIDQFCDENPQGFDKDEIKIVKSWKHFVQGRFLLYKQYKKYCVFMQESEKTVRLYAVQALISDFEEIVPFLPCYADAVLLPFRDVIIYDGVVVPYNIDFGSGMRRGFKDTFDLVKAKHGIIEKLPAEKPRKPDDAKLLRYYLKSAANREIYFDEICDLIDKNDELYSLYCQLTGKRYARKFKQLLRDKNISRGWFAVYEDVIVASGRDKGEAMQNAQTIVSKKDCPNIHFFKVN